MIKNDRLPISLRAPKDVVEALRLRADTEDRSISAVVIRILKKELLTAKPEVMDLPRSG
jgi:plasmid stability protein